MTDEEYAMKFCMLMMLEEKNLSAMKQYAECFKYLMASYSRMLANHPEMTLKEDPGINNEEWRSLAKLLREICMVKNTGLILRQGGSQQMKLLHVLVEAIHRTMVLIYFYAPDGDLLSEVLQEAYCKPKKKGKDRTDVTLNMSQTTYYKRRRQGILYGGFFFFEAVLPEMEGRI